jgi:Tfp pilus assembly protein PilO
MKNKNSQFKAVSPEIKILSIPIVTLLGMAILLIFSLRFGLTKITSQGNEIKNLEKSINTLKQKEQVLMKVKDALANDIMFFSAALPDSNSVLPVIYQIKTFSFNEGLVIDNLKSASESKAKNLSKADVNFDLIGSFASIFSFLEVTQTFSPIVTIENLELSQQGSQLFNAKITLRGYWSPLPKRIPSVGQQLKDFSDEEMDIISRISKLTVPAFVSISPKQEPIERKNPFE